MSLLTCDELVEIQTASMSWNFTEKIEINVITWRMCAPFTGLLA